MTRGVPALVTIAAVGQSEKTWCVVLQVDLLGEQRVTERYFVRVHTERCYPSIELVELVDVHGDVSPETVTFTVATSDDEPSESVERLMLLLRQEPFQKCESGLLRFRRDLNGDARDRTLGDPLGQVTRRCVLWWCVSQWSW